jgi:hypothetical protein
MNVKEVVGIRGLSLQLDEIEYDTDNGESTQMWNPLHFAVYYQNLDLLKYFIKEMKVNMALTAPRPPAENEREAVNNERYAEDKLMLVVMAYNKRNPTMLKFLLDEGYKYWPSKKTVEKLLRSRLIEELTSRME